MDWDDAEVSFFLSAMTGGFYLMNVVASSTLVFWRGVNPIHLYNTAKLLSAISILIFISGNAWAMVAARLLQGYLTYILVPIANGLVSELITSNERGLVATRIPGYYEVCNILVFTSSLFDDLGFWYWRIVYLGFSALLLLDYFVGIILLKGINTPSYNYRVGGEPKMIESARNYLGIHATEELVHEAEAVIGIYKITPSSKFFASKPWNYSGDETQRQRDILWDKDGFVSNYDNVAYILFSYADTYNIIFRK